MDETEILALLQDGNTRKAFEEIVRQFQGKVFRLAYSMSRDSALAQDIAQESLIRVWKALPRYDGRASLSTWIYAISRNVCRTELRRRSSRPSVPFDTAAPAPELEGAAGFHTEPAESTSTLDLNVFLDRLSEPERQVLVLFHLEQKSHAETATLLGMPIGTIKTLLFRTKRRLIEQRLREERHSARGERTP